MHINILATLSDFSLEESGTRMKHEPNIYVAGRSGQNARGIIMVQLSTLHWTIGTLSVCTHLVPMVGNWILITNILLVQIFMCCYKSDGGQEDPWSCKVLVTMEIQIFTLGTHIHVLLQEQWGGQAGLGKGILVLVTMEIKIFTLGTRIHVFLQEQWGGKGILPVVTRALAN